MKSHGPRIDVDTYRALDLRAHDLLADVPLHDAWQLQLEDDGSPISMEDIIQHFVHIESAGLGKPARLLFAIREKAGQWFGWDREDPTTPATSYLHRLTDEDKKRSLDTPGSSRAFWKCLYTFENESVGEVINQTVHAFLVFALRPSRNGYTVFWGIYVKPVNRFTRLYMALIDPFRRYLIYPTLIRRFEASWSQRRREL